jgi:hypothetical protein
LRNLQDDALDARENAILYARSAKRYETRRNSLFACGLVICRGRAARCGETAMPETYTTELPRTGASHRLPRGQSPRELPHVGKPVVARRVLERAEAEQRGAGSRCTVRAPANSAFRQASDQRMAANRNLNCVGTAWCRVAAEASRRCIEQLPKNPQTLARQGV